MFWLITCITWTTIQGQPTSFDEAAGVADCKAIELGPNDVWRYVNPGWLYHKLDCLNNYDQIRLAKPTEKSRQVSTSVLFAT